MNSTETGPVQVIFRDAFLLLADKPPSISVQPDRTGDPSLLQQVQSMFPGMDIGSPHRLDRPVSGITLFTVGAQALQGISAQFRERRVAKTYLAIVEGHTSTNGELFHQLGHAGGSRKATVAEVREGERGNATLRFTTRASGDRYSLLEVVPEGGAFHQIRAQLAAAGHPIKGDVKYGARRGEPDRSIALHAWKISFAHPDTGVMMHVEAPLPSRSIWPALLKL